MRRPTKHELWKMEQNLEGLRQDLDALKKSEAELQGEGVGLSDVLGTFGVNVGALSRTLQHLKEEPARK